MSDKPKRYWFRFHLMTAILLMLLAGFLLFLNSDATLLNRGPHGEEYGCGWPFGFSIVHWDEGPDGPMLWELNFYSYVFADVACSFLILSIVAAISEAVIRHREVRKPFVNREVVVKGG